MPNFCAVIKCSNRSGRDKKSFFRLPVIPSNGSEERRQLIKERRLKWLCAMKRSDLDENKTKFIRICQDHFLTGKPADIYDINHPDWVPSQNLGYEKKNDSSQKMNRYNQVQNRMESETKSLNNSLGSVSAIPDDLVVDDRNDADVRKHNDIIDSSVPFFILPSITLKTETMDEEVNLTDQAVDVRKHNDVDCSEPFFVVPSITPKTETMDEDDNSTDQAVDVRKHNDIDSSEPLFVVQSITLKTETVDEDDNSTGQAVAETIDVDDNSTDQAVAETMDEDDNSPHQAVGFDVEKSSQSACSCDKVCSKILEEIKSLKQEQSRFQEIMLKKIVKLEGDVNKALRTLVLKDSSPEVLDMPHLSHAKH